MYQITPMLMSVNERMKTLKIALDKAPAGAKREAALVHYQAAELAREGHDDAECFRECNQVARALA